MADPFIGEIRIFAFGTIPQGWIPCNGQKLQISANTALFSILGTTYGGDGRVDFAIPDLRGCVPIHPASGIPLGQSSGEAYHTLTIAEMPSHNHMLNVNNTAASSKTPLNNFVSATGTTNSYATGESPNAMMSNNTVRTAGGSVGHNNIQPYLTFNFCIATIGIYPPRP